MKKLKTNSIFPIIFIALLSSHPFISYGAEITVTPGLNDAIMVITGGDNNVFRVFSEKELSGFSKKELRLLRNTLYAKYEYRFKDKNLRKFFSNFKWYKPKKKNVDSKLTPIDKMNLEMIHKLEGPKKKYTKTKTSKGKVSKKFSLKKYISHPWKKWIFSTEVLHKLTKKQLKILKNSIYAKHGYRFKDKSLRKYFSRFKWYHPKRKKMEPKLTKIDRKNIKMIKKFEKK